MKSRFLIVLMVLLGLACSSEDGFETQNPITPNNEIHAILLETITKETIPGLIAAIIDSDGVRLIESAGIRKVDSPEIMTSSDLIHLGSCTKAMTATMLATLVERDEITWETTILETFPELRETIHEDYHGVTLHQLVTHRGGVPENAENWSLREDLGLIERREALILDNLTEPSKVPLGEYQYSNLGYMIAGNMAERVTGLPWEDLMQEGLFDPLGMSTAGFGPPGNPGQVDQPWGHVKSGGNWRALQEDNPVAIGPAGTVHSSFTDWAKFIALQLKEKEPILLNRSQLNFLIEPIGNYAAGWVVEDRSWANGKTLSHNGSNNMWFATLWVAPEIDRAFLVATNSADNKSASILDGIVGSLIEFDQ